MSSSAEGGAVIAGAVLAPLTLTYAAGWLLVQGGKLVVSAVEQNERLVQEKKKELAAAEQIRKDRALVARNKIIDSCKALLLELEDKDDVPSSQALQLDEIRWELKEVCEGSPEGSADEIDRRNAQAMTLLDKITHRLTGLRDVMICDGGEYDGYAVSDLLDDLRISVAASTIRATIGENVVVTSHRKIEREGLQERLEAVVKRIDAALQLRAELAEDPGLYELYEEKSSFFNSCFSGIDAKIQRLYSDHLNNQELKKGIDDLERMMDRYDLIYPSIDRKKKKLAGMSKTYAVYKASAILLGEIPRKLSSFAGLDEINAELSRLHNRAERAKQCSVVYQKLGWSAYVCFAWTQELQSRGYQVKGKNEISELAQYTPERVGELPVYKWDEKAITEFFGLTNECSLQLIVHEDGSTTMQTIAQDGHSDKVVHVQKKHCDVLTSVRKSLKENWFISYDELERNQGSEIIMSATQWRQDTSNAWHCVSPKIKHKSQKQRQKEKAEKAKAARMR